MFWVKYNIKKYIFQQKKILKIYVPWIFLKIWTFKGVAPQNLKMTESKSMVPYSSSYQRSIATPHWRIF